MVIKDFTIQWHLLDDCEYSCNYCYLKEFRIGNSINYNIILKNILIFKNYYKNINVNLTGGNPFFHPNILKIIKTLYLANIKVNILGNPLSSDSFNKIKKVSKYINSYQISFDGSLNGHKSNRKTDNTYIIWKSVDTLNALGIKTNIMFTLTNSNKNELLDALKLSYSKSINSFSFSRVVPINKDQINNIVPPNELRIILDSILIHLSENGIINFDFKENLWNLLFFEKGFYKPRKTLISGCGVGQSSLSIMSDGNVYPCSRIPFILGNIVESSLNEIFTNNALLNQFRDFKNFAKCKGCILKDVCRGCPAVSFALTGNCFKADPQCWKS